MKILFLAHLFPLPLDSGGKIKSHYTLRALAGEHEVRVLAYVRTQDEAARAGDLAQICPVNTVPLSRSKLRQARDLVAALALGRSFVVTRDYRAGMRRAVAAAAQAFKPDVVHIDHLQMAQFVDFDGGFKTVLDHHNVESMIIERLAGAAESAAMRSYAKIEWPKLRRLELDACRKCDLVITVSEEDRAKLKEFEPSLVNIFSVPIGVDVERFSGLERTESRNILSIGTMYWPPNVDSMLYFHREVFPLVRQEVSGCTLTIAGQRPVAAIRALAADPAVRVTGYVANELDTARDCAVFVVPLRSGSGVRVKILNAMAMGLPIVSTSVGAEGLEVVSGEHLLIADDAREFAGAVTRLLQNPEIAADLGRKARELVCRKYSWEVLGKRLLGLYEMMAEGRGMES